MNSTLSPIQHFPSSHTMMPSTTPSNNNVVTFSQMRPRFIEKCVESNPRQLVQVDILGDLVQLPVYALRRRNAMVHF